MKAERAKVLAAREGIFCDDCIFEALRYAGLKGTEVSGKVPHEYKQNFLAFLIEEDMRSHD